MLEVVSKIEKFLEKFDRKMAKKREKQNTLHEQYLKWKELGEKEETKLPEFSQPDFHDCL